MGKTSKWVRNFLTGKKEKEREKNPTNQTTSLGAAENPATTPISIPSTTPKEKRRWSFRRSSATAANQKDSNGMDAVAAARPPAAPSVAELENEQKKHAVAMAAATAAAAEAAVAAAQAAAAVIRLTAAATGRASAMEQAAAVKIQSVFRSFLARKALCALKGVVKLQALVRGHLVRKQATATLRCMQALVTAQARARAQRLGMAEESKPNTYYYYQRPLLNNRKTAQDNRFRHTYHEMEENIKIVEMDLGESKGSTKSRNSYSNSTQTERTEHRFSTHSAPHRAAHSKQDHRRETSPAPTALTDASPRACSGHFEDYSFEDYSSAVSKPDPSRLPFAVDSLSYDCHFFPNYMANTESSRAKARSQSAPKARPEVVFERQPSSRRRASLEGRNVPRAVRMQRSSSQVGPAAQNYQYPALIKLDRSSVSLKESECGSTSTVLTNTIHCRSLVNFDVNGNRY